jgi:hypothetical protein
MEKESEKIKQKRIRKITRLEKTNKEVKGHK